MISLISGFGWPAVARIAAIGGVALAVWLAFNWFTGVLDENLQLQMDNATLQSSLEVEKSARERANRAAADAVRRHQAITRRFNEYRQEVISEQHKDWRDEPLPDGLAGRLRSLTTGSGSGGSKSAGQSDSD